MTFQEYLSCGLFILAIFVNSGSVYAQKRHQIYNTFGANAHRIHTVIINTFWGAFLASLFLLAKVSPVVAQQTFLGWGVIILGGLLFFASVQQIGFDSMSNKDIFTKQKKELNGVYVYVHEPMYTSFTMIFFGSGLATGIAGFYYLSLLSLVGLQLVESRIES